MSSTIDREVVLPPFKSKLQDWYDRARNPNKEDAKKLLTEGYSLFFDILDPIAKDAKIDPNVSARFYLLDRRLKYFESGFLAESIPSTGNVSIKDYSPIRSGEKQATLTFTDGYHIFNTKSITVGYDARAYLSTPSPNGFMRIEENNVAWVRSGDQKMDVQHTKSLTELSSVRLLGLTLSLAHIYTEDRWK